MGVFMQLHPRGAGFIQEASTGENDIRGSGGDLGCDRYLYFEDCSRTEVVVLLFPL